MNTQFRRDANNSYLIIKCSGEHAADYAENMLTKNKIPGLLATEERRINNKREFYYNISSKVAMNAFYGGNKMGSREIKEFVFGLSRAADSIKEYLLDINCLCMEQELIFIDARTGSPEFCYNPDARGDFFSDLKRLLQQVLTMADYEDRLAVEAAYKMQETAAKENYTVEELFKIVNSLGEEAGERAGKTKNGVNDVSGKYMSGGSKNKSYGDGKTGSKEEVYRAGVSKNTEYDEHKKDEKEKKGLGRLLASVFREFGKKDSPATLEELEHENVLKPSD